MTLLEHLRAVVRQIPELSGLDLSKYSLVEMKRGIGTSAGLAFEPGDFALVDCTTGNGEHNAFSFRTGTFLSIANKSFALLPDDTAKPERPLELQPTRRQADASRYGPWMPVLDLADASWTSRSYVEDQRISQDDYEGGYIRDAATHMFIGIVAFDGKIWGREGEQPDERPLFDPEITGTLRY